MLRSSSIGRALDSGSRGWGFDPSLLSFSCKDLTDFNNLSGFFMPDALCEQYQPIRANTDRAFENLVFPKKLLYFLLTISSLAEYKKRNRKCVFTKCDWL